MKYLKFSLSRRWKNEIEAGTNLRGALMIAIIIKRDDDLSLKSQLQPTRCQPYWNVQIIQGSLIPGNLYPSLIGSGEVVRQFDELFGFCESSE